MGPVRLKFAARFVLAAGALVCVWGTTIAPQGFESAIVPWDKAAHFIAFWGLTIAMFAAFPERRRFDLAMIAVLIGCGIEVAQQVTGRDAELGDVAADAAGAFAVLAPIWLERLRAVPRRERRRRATLSAQAARPATRPASL